MDEKELKKQCLNLLEIPNVIYLSTIGGDGFPHTRMMSNLRNKKENPVAAGVLAQHKKDFTIYFVTSRSSAKMQQIRANPKVSAYLCNQSEFQTLMLGGEIEEITDKEFKKKIWQKGWEIHWPAGASDPEFTVLELSPAFAKGCYKEGLFEFKI